MVFSHTMKIYCQNVCVTFLQFWCNRTPKMVSCYMWNQKTHFSGIFPLICIENVCILWTSQGFISLMKWYENQTFSVNTSHKIWIFVDFTCNTDTGIQLHVKPVALFVSYHCKFQLQKSDFHLFNIAVCKNTYGG